MPSVHIPDVPDVDGDSRLELKALILAIGSAIFNNDVDVVVLLMSDEKSSGNGLISGSTKLDFEIGEKPKRSSSDGHWLSNDADSNGNGTK